MLYLVNITEMTKIQLTTELARAERNVDKTAHAASVTNSEELNAQAVQAEQYRNEVRRLLWA